MRWQRCLRAWEEEGETDGEEGTVTGIGKGTVIEIVIAKETETEIEIETETEIVMEDVLVDEVDLEVPAGAGVVLEVAVVAETEVAAGVVAETDEGTEQEVAVLETEEMIDQHEAFQWTRSAISPPTRRRWMILYFMSFYTYDSVIIP